MEDEKGFFTQRGKNVFVYAFYPQQVAALTSAEIKTFGTPHFIWLSFAEKGAKKALRDTVSALRMAGYTQMEFDAFVEKLAEVVGLLRLAGRMPTEGNKNA